MQRWKVQGNVRYTNDKGKEVSRWLAMPKALEEARAAQALGHTNISIEVDWDAAQRVPVAVTQLVLAEGTYDVAVVAPTKPATRAKKVKPPSRPKRWADAAGRALAALQDLEDLRGEFESWRDNLPEGLQQSALGEKLDTIADMDIESAITIAEEADGADLPLGFGRD